MCLNANDCLILNLRGMVTLVQREGQGGCPSRAWVWCGLVACGLHFARSMRLPTSLPAGAAAGGASDTVAARQTSPSAPGLRRCERC